VSPLSLNAMPEAQQNRVLIATIRQLGGCPCPRCLIPKIRLHSLGMARDRQQRTTLLRSDEARDQLVVTARSIIYDQNRGVDSIAVENLLKPCSWVPTCVSNFITCLTQLTSNIRTFFLIDLVHTASTYLKHWL
jgi:hypothetical protein